MHGKKTKKPKCDHCKSWKWGSVTAGAGGGGGRPLMEWVLWAEWMNSGYFWHPACDDGPYTHIHTLSADSFTGSSSDSLWKSPLTTAVCAVWGMFSISSSEIPKVPSMGNWQREGERETRRGGGGGGRRQKRLWMKRMESLESAGPIFNSSFQATDEQ